VSTMCKSKIKFSKDERDASRERVNQRLRDAVYGLRSEEQFEVRYNEIGRMAEYGGVA
jgi:hypothetical protein